MTSDFQIVLPEVIIAIYAMAALLFGKALLQRLDRLSVADIELEIIEAVEMRSFLG